MQVLLHLICRRRRRGRCRRTKLDLLHFTEILLGRFVYFVGFFYGQALSMWPDKVAHFSTTCFIILFMNKINRKLN